MLGALLLVVVHPAFVAARSAPRSWGWFAAAACLAGGAALALHPRVRVEPGELAGAHVLVPAVATLALVLGSSATAVAGTRRKVLPLLLAVAWTLHGRELLAPWPASSRAMDAFVGELRATAAREGRCGELWVVDAPLADDELARLPRGFAWILHPGLGSARAAAGDAAVELARSTRVRALDADTLLFVAREPEFARVRAQGLVLSLPPGFAARAPEDGAGKDPPADAVAGPASRTAERWSLRLAPEGAAPAERIWRRDGRSEELDCEPLTVRAVRANALSGASTAEAPRLAWRARDERLDGGRAVGVWIEGESGAQAWFDLAVEPRWLFGRRIARVQLEGELRRILSAELLADVPAPRAAAFEPETRGDDWLLARPEGPLPRPLRGDAAWSLVLLDPAGLASARVPLEPSNDGRLRARSAAAAARRLAPTDAELVWALEYRAGGVTLVRLAGRRAFVRGRAG
ncbi:MAG: hypothetical protein IPJ77_03660 [Planctomycetes bacterium]|nr:hypothetical protein [Planctomycetota bacterium]